MRRLLLCVLAIIMGILTLFSAPLPASADGNIIGPKTEDPTIP